MYDTLKAPPSNGTVKWMRGLAGLWRLLLVALAAAVGVMFVPSAGTVAALRAGLPADLANPDTVAILTGAAVAVLWLLHFVWEIVAGLRRTFLR